MPPPDVHEAIAYLTNVVGAAERVLGGAVYVARAGGASWATIGAALGVSKQTAYNRHNDMVTVLRAFELAIARQDVAARRARHPVNQPRRDR